MVSGRIARRSSAKPLQLARASRAPAEVRRLTVADPKSYNGGTALRGCTIEGIGLNGALLPDSLVLKAEKGPAGRRFVEGKDWRADKQWGRVGRLAGGQIGPETDVLIDYDYGLQRLDLIEVRSDGQLALRSGAEDKTIPAAPQADQFARPLCNVYLPPGCREITTDAIYPIGPPYPTASEDEISHNASLIPSTLAKLEKGGDFTLLFWAIR